MEVPNSDLVHVGTQSYSRSATGLKVNRADTWKRGPDFWHNLHDKATAMLLESTKLCWHKSVENYILNLYAFELISQVSNTINISNVSWKAKHKHFSLKLSCSWSPRTQLFLWWFPVQTKCNDYQYKYFPLCFCFTKCKFGLCPLRCFL